MVDSCGEDDEVFVDLPPVAVVALRGVEPEVALSLVEVEDVGGREDDLALGIGGDCIEECVLLATSVCAPQ